MQIEIRDLNSIKPYENNPRINDDAVDSVVASIREFGFRQPIVVDGAGVIIVGHTRWKAAHKMGLEKVPVHVAVDLPAEKVKAYRIADNQTATLSEWDYKLLPVELQQLQDMNFDLSSLGFSDDELSKLLDMDGEIDEYAVASMMDKFIIPPFTVLDSRQGYWQERKQRWIDLGITESDAARADMKTTGVSFTGTDPEYYDKKRKVEAKLGRQISHDEFKASHYTPLEGSSLKATAAGGILSMFDPVLCEILYRWFCPPGGSVIDPFSGGAVRGICASVLGYGYLGFDVRAEQVNANIQAAKKMPLKRTPAWIAKDIRAASERPDSWDFVFSCPPYGDLEKYSDLDGDISNMPHDQFIKEYRAIIAAAVGCLKPERFACFIVGDFRDGEGFYRDFVGDTVQAFADAGARLYNEAVFITPAGSLPIRAGKIFSKTRKLGKSHQNILIFYKGSNPKTIKENFPATVNPEVSDD